MGVKSPHMTASNAASAGLTVSMLALTCALAGAQPVAAQSGPDDLANRRWQAGAISHAQRMRAFRDVDDGLQPTPREIPVFSFDFDPSGMISTFQPAGPTRTSKNAFFQDLGTNGRTCFTCHQGQDGWSVSASHVQARFHASFGADPIFRLVDGAVCPTADVSTLAAKQQAYALLLRKGLIRVGLSLPTTGLEYNVSVVSDPYACNTNPATGLSTPTNATSGVVSVYRRPLPSTNIGFLSTIMWDGREPSFESQANDATRGHAQGAVDLTPAQVAEIVSFQRGIFTAQIFDDKARRLDEDGARGGPVALQQQLASFFIGVNDPFGLNPRGIPFTSTIFDIYNAWKSIAVHNARDAARASVARGQELFNNTPINITGVAGINDVVGGPLSGFCGTCHDTPNVGNHSVKAPLNIGIADAGALSPPVLDTSDLPVFKLHCTSGPLAGRDFFVTDPGRALISGKCADIGKLKGPILRGLASRAPFFHNGGAATLEDVVLFYDQRFGIGLSAQDRADLAAFLKTL